MIPYSRLMANEIFKGQRGLVIIGIYVQVIL
jgi:hypothetical protein